MKGRHVLAIAAVGLAAAAAWWLWPKDVASVAAVPPPTQGDAPRDPPRPAAPTARASIDAATEGVSLWVIAADTGAPIAEARVLRAKYAGAATSDARGAVVFPWADTELQISAPFMKSREGTFRFGDTVELEPLPVVRGEVVERTNGLDKVRPVAGAEVSTDVAPFTQAVTGPDGKFELRVAREFGHIGARKDGRFGLGQFNQHDADLQDVFIILEPVQPVDGTVVDSKGTPLEGATVAWSAGLITERTVTGPDGKWKVPQWGKEVTVAASKPGYLPFVKRPSSHPGREPLQTRIALFRAAALTGVVQTPDGRPVGGATVEADHGSAVSGPDGRFALAGLSPHTREVEATLGPRRGTTEVVLTEAGTTSAVVVLPPELIDVPLRLVDGVGAEVECDTATATPIPAEGWTSDFAPERKALPLRAGRFRIEVAGADDHLADVTVDVRPPAPLTITVHRDPNAEEDPGPEKQLLTVRVKSASGVAVGAATVACNGASGLTREDGTFACELWPRSDRPVHITATKGLARGVGSVFGAETALDVVVRPVRSIRVKVSGPLPPGPNHVSVKSAFEAATIPLNGTELVLADRAPVRTLLCVGHADQRLGCAVVDDQPEVTIAVGPPGALTATVLDEKGAPLEAAIVYLSWQSALAPTPKGVLTLSSPPGTYLVVVNASGTRARAETVVTVRSGETTQVGTLQLK